MQQVPSPHQAPLRATFLTLLLTIFVADLHGAPDEIVQEVTLGEETLTMRLTRVDLRSPNFDFRIQQAQGTIRRLNAVPEPLHSWLIVRDARAARPPTAPIEFKPIVGAMPKAMFAPDRANPCFFPERWSVPG